MRLEKIKLAGFKSFVDPTHIPLPGNLVGIVGPNGCGKSNVIDAVRWVMGESSAKHLRGDLMADVIFNGSSARKPVGQASVELLFDNSDGTVTGEYAGYNQISIKRQVTREGQSTYLLNGSRCRRKDITDLFLGTGLGPRSYAIIEQGTISRLIEAKPDELRHFLEEAAGISKYRERRRDTENRIRRTRENLERISDLCDELEKQCRHLKRQATMAEKYKELKQQERKIKAELLALRWRNYDQQASQHQAQVSTGENKVEQAIAEQRRVEKDIEAGREKDQQARQHCDQIQSSFYALGSEIAKIEQSIQHKQQLQQQRDNRLREHQAIVDSSRVQIEQETTQASDLKAQQAQFNSDLEQLERQYQVAQEKMSQAESDMQQWQDQWDQFAQQSAEPRRLAEVERASITHSEKSLSRFEQREQQLQEEIGRLQALTNDSELVGLEQQVQTLETERDQYQSQLESLSSGLTAQRQNLHQLNDELASKRTQLSSDKGRLSSVDALQQAALGKEQGSVLSWLRQQSLSENARLAELLDVEEGWERAIEVVLQRYLDAVCVDHLDNFLGKTDRWPEGVMTLVQRDQPSTESTSSSELKSLATRLRGPSPAGYLLENVFCADSLADAQRLAKNLSSQQSVVTREGIWLGAQWLRIDQPNDQQDGVLSREKQKRSLMARCQELESAIASLEKQVSDERSGLQAAEHQRESLQKQATEQNRLLSQATIAFNSKTNRIEQAQQRLQQLQQELDALAEQREQEYQAMLESRDRLSQALAAVDQIEAQRDQLKLQRDAKRELLESARSQTNQLRDQVHGLRIKLESNRSAQALNARNIEAMNERLGQSEKELVQLTEEQQQASQPFEQEQTQLKTLLARRQQQEQVLTEAREAVQTVENDIRHLESQRHQAEQQVQTRREAVAKIQMECQAILVRKQTVTEQLDEAGVKIEEVLGELPAEASEAEWQSQTDAMVLRIQRLGAINLTAIEEFATQSERKQYLDSQSADLNESLATLEQAIAKIDRESRQLFKETFEKVNAGFEMRFPKLFGGGHAYLQLTGDDLLETGVTVMARPPGKRNSSIHLLSGGEKALTAVALVFAIFDLNPAPFCMLDEVDAPLDEANVGRFGDLVKAMSEQVQIVLITHNKATMEIANQLAGVTMNEPGVSRLVAVDLDEAAEMVAAV